MTRAVAAVVVAALASCGCDPGLALQRRARRMICADGLPVRVITDERCQNGVCGWTCHPDRWRQPVKENRP